MQTTQQIVEITSSAINKFKNVILKNSEPEKPYLRVGVKGGGCSGLSYILEMDEKTDFDLLLNFDGVDVIIDKRHALYLEGTRIDFKDGEHHANQETHESCKSHLYSDELELKINQFNVIVSIYITINYLNNRSKYPLSDKNADFYNNIIDGLEGKY